MIPYIYIAFSRYSSTLLIWIESPKPLPVHLQYNNMKC